jgi:hypothetical protein
MVSKNWKINITWCSTNWHWFVIDCSVVEIIELTKNLFITTLLPNLLTNLSYICFFNGVNLNGGFSMKYGLLYFLLVETSCDLLWTNSLLIWKIKILPNKIVQGVGINLMEEMFVLQEYTMEITSMNQDPIYYCK